jgi:hypothetical protein
LKVYAFPYCLGPKRWVQRSVLMLGRIVLAINAPLPQGSWPPLVGEGLKPTLLLYIPKTFSGLDSNQALLWMSCYTTLPILFHVLLSNMLVCLVCPSDQAHILNYCFFDMKFLVQNKKSDWLSTHMWTMTFLFFHAITLHQAFLMSLSSNGVLNYSPSPFLPHKTSISYIQTFNYTMHTAWFSKIPPLLFTHFFSWLFSLFSLSFRWYSSSSAPSSLTRRRISRF